MRLGALALRVSLAAVFPPRGAAADLTGFAVLADGFFVVLLVIFLVWVLALGLLRLVVVAAAFVVALERFCAVLRVAVVFVLAVFAAVFLLTGDFLLTGRDAVDFFAEDVVFTARFRAVVFLVPVVVLVVLVALVVLAVFAAALALAFRAARGLAAVFVTFLLCGVDVVARLRLFARALVLAIIVTSNSRYLSPSIQGVPDLYKVLLFLHHLCINVPTFQWNVECDI